jgi:hypothetical protein
MVKNRNKITKECLELREEMRCKAAKPHYLRTPAYYLVAILPFC